MLKLIIFVQVGNFGNFYGGDPYTGSREEEFKKKNSLIQELQAENKKLKNELAQLRRRWDKVDNANDETELYGKLELSK